MQNFVKNTYNGFDVKDCEKIEIPNQQFYEISLKMEKNLELLVSLDGKLIEEKKEKKLEIKYE